MANFLDDDTAKSLLKAELHALTIEALRVVPSNRQNLLRRSIGQEVPFERLSDQEQRLITEEIMKGKASPLLLEYFAETLISYPSARNWRSLSRLVSLYWDSAKEDPATAIVLGLITRRAFIKNAETRFEFMRGFFDSLVRYREAKVNFVLLAEYIRLVQVDAVVLEKYDFLRAATGAIIDIFRESKPRFLVDEFLLDARYYCFDENNAELLKQYFESRVDFYSAKNARRYQSMVDLNRYEDLRFFQVELDPISRYYIRGVRKEVATRGKVQLNFVIKHTYDGLVASDFRT